MVHGMKHVKIKYILCLKPKTVLFSLTLNMYQNKKRKKVHFTFNTHFTKSYGF